MSSESTTPTGNNHTGGEHGWVKLYHPSGVLVTLPVTAGVDKAAANAALAAVNAYIDAGWLVNLPDLEAGEHAETVSHLVRREKVNDDGSTTPVIDVYAGGQWRLVSVYLNNEEDVLEFEKAFGFAYDALPFFPGTAPLQRGKNAAVDSKYVTALNGGVKVVWKPNPLYEEGAGKAKRHFVRWIGRPEAKPSEPPPVEPTPQDRGGRPYAPDDFRRALTQAAETMAKQIAEKRAPPVDVAERKVLAAALAKVFETPAERYAACEWLTGVASTREIPPGFVRALLRAMKVETFEHDPSDVSKQELRAALQEAMAEAG